MVSMVSKIEKMVVGFDVVGASVMFGRNTGDRGVIIGPPGLGVGETSVGSRLYHECTDGVGTFLVDGCQKSKKIENSRKNRPRSTRISRCHPKYR